ncbi:patatin-like phospholipase family protein [Falsigemmobacter faecalis]|uniref:Patatin n=1 Tax=Falsigemmobacter faecalis TaxID=2488730 RepID=A0A3P3DWW0_9RHOB|nr:patatin-like phospholipase family protein [Falsigemmobacter faecalis]RRH78474.1 patatin [Falsigemmobacter faecalis]
MTAQPSGRTALVLGSGGARGWCHIGVLRGIEALGLRPDMLVGCSMGALVGAAWAAGQLDALEDFARGLTRSRVLRMLDLRPGSGGLIGGGGITHLLLGELGLSGSFADLPLPFTAVAADLDLGQEIWLQRGDLAPAIRASAAMPGILAPQWLEGRWLIDGAVVNPVPVSVARAMGAASVVAVNPTTRVLRPASHPLPPEGDTAAPAPSRFARLIPLWSEKAPAAVPPAPGYLTLVAQALDIMSERIRRSRLAGDPPDLLIGARLQDLSALDFHRAGEAIDEGHRIAELHRDVLREWLRPSASTAGKTPPPPEPPSAEP